MKLTNPTDSELNAAFAEKVAGWQMIAGGPGAFGGNINPYWQDEKGRACFDGPWFVYSADAVLPWLEKRDSVNIHHPCWPDKNGRPDKKTVWWRVTISDSIGTEYESYDPLLPRAAVIALLRANGVQVEFTAQ